MDFLAAVMPSCFETVCFLYLIFALRVMARIFSLPFLGVLFLLSSRPFSQKSC